MSQTKKIEAVIPPPRPHMVGDGFRVHGFLPGNGLSKYRMSPFFMMDYGSKYEFTPTDQPRGVGVHPHAGFETVTIAYQGKIAHHDSAGNSGVIGQGDVQWMTAGSGLLHKEYHEEAFSRAGGTFQMVQLWVNLPSKDKKTKPKYQPITNDMMGRFHLPGKNGFIEVIAGECRGIKGPASTFTPIEMYNARLEQGAEITITLPEKFNTCMLVVEGKVQINGSPVETDHFVLFQNEGTDVQITATEKSIILVLSGEPIDEPIAAYGPFLMNTWQEVEQAINDVNSGKFGVLEE